jgi:DNA-directed RNA polymerase subunit F
MADDEPSLAEGQRLSIPEVHHLLEKERAHRGELSYEQKLALDHAKAFDRIGDYEQVTELLEELREVDRVSDEQAVKLVEVLPQTTEELTAIFSEDRRELTDEDADTIISIVSDCL